MVPPGAPPAADPDRNGIDAVPPFWPPIVTTLCGIRVRTRIKQVTGCDQPHLGVAGGVCEARS